MGGHSRRVVLGTGLAAVAAAALRPADAFAQETYPSRPVTVVNPFAPGSVSDAAARLVAQSLQEQFGQPVIVENKVGGGGLLAASFVQRAKPDGYTLMLTASSSFSGAALYKLMPFDPVTDFTHIARIGGFPSFVAADVRLPVKTIQEFVAYAKANPGKLSYGHGNNMGQIVGEILKLRTGADIVRVPYRSSPAGVVDLISGQIQMMVPDFGTGLAHAKGGRIRPLAMFSKERHPELPDVPTMDETIMPGFELTAWCGLSAPAKMPADLTQKISGAVEKALNDPVLRQRFVNAGVDVFYGNPQEFQRFVKFQLENWTKLIKDAGIQPEG